MVPPIWAMQVWASNRPWPRCPRSLASGGGRGSDTPRSKIRSSGSSARVVPCLVCAALAVDSEACNVSVMAVRPLGAEGYRRCAASLRTTVVRQSISSNVL